MHDCKIIKYFTLVELLFINFKVTLNTLTNGH